MSGDDFFSETRDQSLVKARIVSNYFANWAKVMIPTARKTARKIAYLDLYAGQGCYDDGTKSTPILVLEQALQNPDLREMLVTMFNDKDPSKVACLADAISRIPGIEALRHKPQLNAGEVDENFTAAFQEANLVPTLLFLDPCGYKGLSVDLVNSVVKDWGCEAVFFFNYNRINMGLSNSIVESHMNAIFGKSRGDDLRQRIRNIRPDARERAILDALVDALMEKHGKFVLPFKFKNENGTRTSHYLIFVSKNFLGYDIMKDVMAAESSRSWQRVASFEYDPSCDDQMELDMWSPLDELADRLMSAFCGRQITMRQVYEEHTVGTPYTSRNYKDALRSLESSGRILADPPANRRRRRLGDVTFADNVVVTFPAEVA